MATDYWTAETGQRSGRCWCAVVGGVWHLLTPGDPPALPRVVAAVPWRRRGEPGYFWRVQLASNVAFRVDLCCFVRQQPEIPERGAKWERTLMTYSHWLPGLHDQVEHGFGVFTASGVPRAGTCRLIVTRAKATADAGYQ